MVQETFKAVPMDLARVMYGNVVLAGGTTLLPGAFGVVALHA